MAAKSVAHVFGQNLRRARRAADISQEELGFSSGLHRTEIGLLERGERVPRLDTLLRVAAGVGVRIDSPLVEGIAWMPGDLMATRGTFSFSSGDEEGGGGCLEDADG
jgi:transcriptional regulator with XRE-family HTH domain